MRTLYRRHTDQQWTSALWKHCALAILGVVTVFTRSISATPVLPTTFSYSELAQNAESLADQEKAAKLLQSGIDKTYIWGWDDAISDFTQAIHLVPTYAEAYYYRGVTLLEKPVSYQQWAVEDLTQAILHNHDYLEAYYRRGIVRIERGDKRGAIADFTQVIRIDSNHAEAYYRRGLLRKESGDQQGAIADFNRVIQLVPDYAEVYYSRGLVFFDQEDEQKATKDFVQAIELSLDERNDKGRKETAIKDYQTLLKAYPQFAATYYRGVACLNVIQFSCDSEKDLIDAIQLKPDFAPGYYYLGLELNGKEAIKRFTQVIELNPHFAEAYFERGLKFSQNLEFFHDSDVEDKPRAIEDFGRAIQLNSNFAEAYYHRGLVYSKIGDDKKATEDFIQALQLKPNLWNYIQKLNRGGLTRNAEVDDYIQAPRLHPKDATTYYKRGLFRHSLGDLKGSARDYNQAIRLDSNVAEFYYYRGFTRGLSRSGEPNGGVSDFSKAIQLKPDFAEAYYNRGFLRYYDAGYQFLGEGSEKPPSLPVKRKQKRAIEDLTQAIRLNSNLAIAYYILGYAFEYPKLDEQRAIESFAQMIRVDPNLFNNADPYSAFSPELTKDMQLEIHSLTQTLKVNPGNIDTQYRRGFAFLKLGDSQRAIQDFNEVIQIEPKNADVYYGRGQAYQKLKTFEASIKDLSKAIQLNPNFADAYMLRGLVRYDTGDSQGGVEDSTKAIRLAPDNASAFLVRSLALKHLGDRLGAKRNYEKAKSIWPCIVCAGGSDLQGEPIIYYDRGITLARRGDSQGAIKNLKIAANLFRTQGNLPRSQ